ncbi:hypothetical protein [Streptacidiphilus cavernicola]|uniref:Uncharacterized protein n=1 Tax=Streptacidiphilus cavernicola TaxID=3342716 RepID=A0ABV6VS66_9ACTN
MQVLFLALGASRRRAVLEESAAVAASGGRAVVLVGQRKPWSAQEFAPGVEVLTADELEGRHLPRRWERRVLHRAPRSLAKALGRATGQRRRFDRVLASYERGVAGRLHRRVFLPFHRRVWPDAAAAMAKNCFSGPDGPDLLVVADALSVTHALRLLDGWEKAGAAVPGVSYSIDTADTPPSAAAR